MESPKKAKNTPKKPEKQTPKKQQAHQSHQPPQPQGQTEKHPHHPKPKPKPKSLIHKIFGCIWFTSCNLFVISVSVLLFAITIALSNGTLSEYKQNFAEEFPNGTEWHNTAGIQRCRPRALFYPKSTQEISKIISSYPKVKVVGAGHSFSPIVGCDQETALINLDFMNKTLAFYYPPPYHPKISAREEEGIEEIYQDGLTDVHVEFEAGIRIAEIHKRLAKYGFAIETRGAISVQSLAGATSTGTHGSSYIHGSLSSLITGIKLLDGYGQIIVANNQTNKNIFDSARTGLGAVGVVVSITLKVVDEFYLRKVEKTYELDEILEKNEDWLKENDYFFWYWVMNTNTGRVIKWNKVPQEQFQKGFVHTIQDYIDRYDVILFSALSAIVAKFPGYSRLYYQAMEKVLWSFNKEFVAESSRVFDVPTLPRYTYDAEYYFPREKCNEAFLAMKKAFKETKLDFNINGVFAVRYIHQDDIWLSPFYKVDTCAIDIHATRQGAKPELTKFLQKVFAPFNPRVHYGKDHFMTNEEMKQQFPKLEDFKSVIRTTDPRQVFLNDHLRKLLDVPNKYPLEEKKME